MADQFDSQHTGFQRCYHHSQRQAVVRCPICLNHYCRECVTEHDDRMLCTNCLNHHLQTGFRKTRAWMHPFLSIFQGTAGFVVLWYGFFLLGKVLLAIPSSFHEGTLWETLSGLFQ